ncbi:MAG: CHAP domain-containing protein [Oscillospiraceae bacterium]|nr:CHAP domain-containing protein [Oscillospiraceae bacterium]
MQRYLPPEAEFYNKQNHRRSIWKKIVSGLACVVVFCTTYVLILPAITQERETRCGYEVHTHEDSCYVQTSATKTLICTPATPCAHTHSELCYDDNSELICQLPEVIRHEHTDSCYAPAETAAPVTHTHSDVCYTQEQGGLVCQLEENEEHTHGAECYTWSSVLACGMEEGETEPTTAAEPVLICTEPQLEEHVHSDSCFKTVADDTLTCTLAENEDHTHTERCYGTWALACGLEEHQHELSCYSNPEADVETAADWEATFADAELTGVWTEDVLTIAETQLGYTESTSNYAVGEGDTINGYTRYGAWYGKPYDEWCAMFVSFCLDYAGVEGMPLNASCKSWIEALSAKDCGLYQAAGDQEPQPGELIFFDGDGDGISDHVGLVAEIIAATDTEPAKVKTIEGNSSNCVQYVTYELDDPAIMGYATLPDQQSEEERAQVDEVIALIDELLAYDEITALMEQYAEDETEESLTAWYAERMKVSKAFYLYGQLSELQQSYVTNVDELNELSSFYVDTYGLDNQIPIYQINSYYPSGGSDASYYGPLMIWNDPNDSEANWGSYSDDSTENRSEKLGGDGSYDVEVQETWMYDQTFNYWDAVAVTPVKDANGKFLNYYKVTTYDVSTGDKTTIAAPEGGFVLIYTNTSAHDLWLSSLSIKIGSYVTITPSSFDFTKYPGGFEWDDNGGLVFDEDGGYYKSSPYCTVTFSDDPPETETKQPEGANKVNIVEAASTRDYIELNLYDYYGSYSAGKNGKKDINEYYNQDKRNIGFQWNGGAYPYYYYSWTQSPYWLIDRNYVDNIDFGNSMITDYRITGYASPANSSGYGVISNVSDGAQLATKGDDGKYNTDEGYINWIHTASITNKPIGLSTFGADDYTSVISSKLQNGYPALTQEGTPQASLEYLFSDSDYAKKRNTQSIDGLFQYNEVTGEYSYNSRENHAQYNEKDDTFTLYEQIITPNFILYPFGNFLPFNDITNGATSKQVGSMSSEGSVKNYIEGIMDDLENSSDYSTDKSKQQLWNMLYSYKSNWSLYVDQSGYTSHKWSSLTAADVLNDFFNHSANPELDAAGINWYDTKPQSILNELYNIDYDVEKNFFFGMEMKMNFYQPKNGMTGQDTNKDGQFDYPMYFKFTGDDDVWVYIDDVLFLDLSGIHRHVGGMIDFVNGEVKYYALNSKSNGDVNIGTDEPYYTISFETILKEFGGYSDAQIAEKLKKVNGEYTTFKDYTNHSFQFYYMERGSGSSVCRMNFNFPLVQFNTISVKKELGIQDDDDTTYLGEPEYTFQVLAATANTDDDGNVTSYTKTDKSYFKTHDSTGGHWAYSLYDSGGNPIQEVHVVDKNPDGTVKTLEVWRGNRLLEVEKDGEVTYYTGVQDSTTLEWIKTNTDDDDPENDGKTPSPDLLTIDENGQFTLKAGQRAEFVGIIESWGPYYVKEVLPEGVSKGEVKVSTYVYHGDVADENNPYSGDTKDPNQSLVFEANTSTYFTITNPVKTGNLTITKNVETGDQEKEFEFKVTLDGELLPVGTKYKVGTQEKTVGTAGVIKLKHGETATISNILAGTTFEVTETTSGYIATYSGGDTEAGDTSATGTIVYNETSAVTVSNTEVADTLDIKLRKTLSNADSNERTYKFNLTEVTATESSDGSTVTDIAVVTDGTSQTLELTVSNQRQIGTFQLSYKEVDVGTFYYQITEDLTGLTDVKANARTFIVKVVVQKNTDGTISASLAGTWKRENASSDFAVYTVAKSDQGKYDVTYNNVLINTLTIGKTVVGGTVAQNADYTFTITFTKGGAGLGAKYPMVVKDADGNTVRDGNLTISDLTATFTLKHGQTITINNLPVGTGWTVTETTPDGFKVTYSGTTGGSAISGDGNAASGTINKDGSTVTFTNTQTYELPETGGAGTKSYTILGLLLIFIGTAFLMYSNRKRRREGV